MQGKHLFEYAVVRVVPRVEREEFLNVGVILYCADKRFLETMYLLNPQKLLAIANDLDVEEIEKRLFAFTEVCKGNGSGGPIGKLPLASRFRWLAATRSTILQISPVHPGLCIDPKQTLESLFQRLVV